MIPSTILAQSNLENLEKVEGGYFISNENIVSLAQYIESLKTENEKLKAKNQALNEALESERKKINEVINTKNMVIEQQDEQIKLLNDKLSSNELWNKASLMAGGAGIASVVILFAVLQ